MREIRLSAATPRRLDAIEGRLDPRSGLYAGYGFGLMFLAGAVALPLALALVPGPARGPVLFPMIAGPLFFGGLALIFLLPARRRYRARLAALTGGALVTARVTGQRRAWVPYSSFRDHVIDAAARLEDGRTATGALRTRRAAVAEALPVGSALQALTIPGTGRLFLPAEIGVTIAAVAP